MNELERINKELEVANPETTEKVKIILFFTSLETKNMTALCSVIDSSFLDLTKAEIKKAAKEYVAGNIETREKPFQGLTPILLGQILSGFKKLFIQEQPTKADLDRLREARRIGEKKLQRKERVEELQRNIEGLTKEQERKYFYACEMGNKKTLKEKEEFIKKIK